MIMYPWYTYSYGDEQIKLLPYDVLKIQYKLCMNGIHIAMLMNKSNSYHMMC